jgi:hypothetical protein
MQGDGNGEFGEQQRVHAIVTAIGLKPKESCGGTRTRSNRSRLVLEPPDGGMVVGKSRRIPTGTVVATGGPSPAIASTNAFPVRIPLRFHDLINPNDLPRA